MHYFARANVDVEIVDQWNLRLVAEGDVIDGDVASAFSRTRGRTASGISSGSSSSSKTRSADASSIAVGS